MPIYDSDGTSTYQINKLFDSDGTSAYQIGKVYDNNGTTSNLIYASDITLFSNGATTDSGTWTGYNAYLGTKPTIGSTISYPAMTNGSFYGSLASCASPITLNGSHTLSFDMTKCSYSLWDTNLAIGATWGVRIYAVFSTSKITLDKGTIDTITWATNLNEYRMVNAYKTYGPDATSGSIAAGTKSTTINLTGNYYFGLLLAGYDAQTSAFTVNNIKIV